MDDGVLVCSPKDFDSWVRVFNEEIQKIGVTRGSGHDVKSEAKLVCKSGEEHLYSGWDTAYVKNTCRVLEPNSASEYLGAIVGDPDVAFEALRIAFGKARAKQEAIASLAHPAAELVLTRRCADVSNITYWMRCYGDRVPHDISSQFDAQLRRALEDTLGGDLHDAAWWQATLGVTTGGGLGLRTAHDSCLPAFIGSRVSARPLVKAMLQSFEDAGLG